MWYHKYMIKNSGQIAVFVLLIMLLGLTVGLSVMSRTLTDLKSAAISDQSSRAFTAAEAGIEAALSRSDLDSIAGTTDFGEPQSISVNTVGVNYRVKKISNYSIENLEKDDVAQIDLTGYTSGPIVISWTHTPGCANLSGDGGNAALEVSFYNFNGTVYGVDKYAYDPYDCSIDDAVDHTHNANGFIVAAAATTAGYNSKVEYPTLPSAGAKLIRIRPIYNSTRLLVEGVPSQSYDIKSTATTGNNVTRAVQITKSKPSLPPIFDYVLFGPAGAGVSQ
jgi:hypothetical protein